MNNNINNINKLMRSTWQRHSHPHNLHHSLALQRGRTSPQSDRHPCRWTSLCSTLSLSLLTVDRSSTTEEGERTKELASLILLPSHLSNGLWSERMKCQITLQNPIPPIFVRIWKRHCLSSLLRVRSSSIQIRLIRQHMCRTSGGHNSNWFYPSNINIDQNF